MRAVPDGPRGVLLPPLRRAVSRRARSLVGCGSACLSFTPLPSSVPPDTCLPDTVAAEGGLPLPLHLCCPDMAIRPEAEVQQDRNPRH
jgi:hypothetical protein